MLIPIFLGAKSRPVRHFVDLSCVLPYARCLPHLIAKNRVPPKFRPHFANQILVLFNRGPSPSSQAPMGPCLTSLSFAVQSPDHRPLWTRMVWV